MKITRWLISNFFLMLLIVTVIYSYIFWGNLIGSDTPAGKAVAYLSSEFVEVEEFVNAVKARQKMRQQVNQQADTNNNLSDKSFATPEAIAKTAAEDVQLVQHEKSDNAKAVVSQAKQADKDKSPLGQIAAVSDDEKPAIIFKNDINQAAVTITYSQNKIPGRKNSVEVLQEEDESAQKNIHTNETEADEHHHNVAKADITPLPVVQQKQTSAKVLTDKDTFVPVEIEKQLDNVDNHGQVIDVAIKNNSIRQIWVIARKSYYQRDYALSEKSYKQVIETTRDNFDAYGELGNVYFNQGKNKQAASAYFEAASILLRKGRVNRARSLTAVLQHLDGQKAEALQRLLDSKVQDDLVPPVEVENKS